MLNAILSRWARSRAASSTTLPPYSPSFPGQRSAGDSLWQSLLRLIPGEPDPWGGAATRQPPLQVNHNFPAARAAFRASLTDLEGESIEELQRSIRRSRSLGDLWHLRTWLYTEVARAHSQQEAERRLAELQPHFAVLENPPRRH